MVNAGAVVQLKKHFLSPLSWLPVSVSFRGWRLHVPLSCALKTNKAVENKSLKMRREKKTKNCGLVVLSRRGWQRKAVTEETPRLLFPHEFSAN